MVTHAPTNLALPGRNRTSAHLIAHSGAIPARGVFLAFGRSRVYRALAAIPGRTRRIGHTVPYRRVSGIPGKREETGQTNTDRQSPDKQCIPRPSAHFAPFPPEPDMSDMSDLGRKGLSPLVP